MLLKVLVAITGMIGIQMTSFVAIIGAAGLAVDWPIRNASEFCRGVVILILKPFKVGDFIEGYGTVKKLAFFNDVEYTR
jgi:small conductance mechanosensitive channel